MRTIFYNKIDSFFKLSDRKTTIKKELIGGLSTFLAMMYIFSVNPAILSGSNGENIYESAIFLGTVLSSFLGTFLIGIFANVPISMAPGMGINAFFAYTVASVGGFNLDYYEALVCVFLSGVVYTIVVITPIRGKMISLLSNDLKLIMTVMIGFFLSYVGLKNIGIVSTPSGFSEIGQNFNPDNANYPVVIVGTIALIIGVTLHYCKIKNSIIYTSIIALIMLIIVWAINPSFTSWNNNGTLIQAFSIKPFNEFASFGIMINSFFSLENWGNALSNPISYLAIFTFLYVDFFDTSNSIIALGKTSNLIIEGKEKESDKWIKKVNYIDSASTICGSILLNSSVTVVSESGVGIQSGARTGIASIVNSGLILLVLPLWPIMGPFMPIANFQPVTGHAIFITGLCMISQMKSIDYKNFINVAVLSLSSLFATLGYSISAGLSWGMMFYFLIVFGNDIRAFIKNKNEKFKLSLNYVEIIICALSTIFVALDLMIKAKVF